MYESRAYEFYSARLASLKPVEGTVKRGAMLPYHLKAEDTAQANLVANPWYWTKPVWKKGSACLIFTAAYATARNWTATDRCTKAATGRTLRHRHLC